MKVLFKTSLVLVLLSVVTFAAEYKVYQGDKYNIRTVRIDATRMFPFLKTGNIIATVSAVGGSDFRKKYLLFQDPNDCNPLELSESLGVLNVFLRKTTIDKFEDFLKTGKGKNYFTSLIIATTTGDCLFIQEQYVKEVQRQYDEQKDYRLGESTAIIKGPALTIMKNTWEVRYFYFDEFGSLNEAVIQGIVSPCEVLSRTLKRYTKNGVFPSTTTEQ
jgi:hypothetical protein